MKKVTWALVVIALGIGAYYMFAPKQAEVVEAEAVEACCDSCAVCDSAATCDKCDSTVVAE